MAQLRVVNYREPSAFLAAMERYDNTFMNSILGNFHDLVHRTGRSIDPSTASMWAVYREDDLMCVTDYFASLTA